MSKSLSKVLFLRFTVPSLQAETGLKIYSTEIWYSNLLCIHLLSVRFPFQGQIVQSNFSRSLVANRNIIMLVLGHSKLKSPWQLLPFICSNTRILKIWIAFETGVPSTWTNVMSKPYSNVCAARDRKWDKGRERKIAIIPDLTLSFR